MASNVQSSVENLPAKPADTVPGVHELILARWSPRSFSDRPVSTHDLLVLLDAARWAASSYNEQPWRFIVARNSDGELYDRILGLLAPFNQLWAKSAPVLLIAVAKRHFTHNGSSNLHSMHDTGAALAQLALQATAIGLHTHGMAGFDRDRAQVELNIPEEFEPVTAVALGYAGSPDLLPEPYKERELSPRQRKPLNDIVFGGRWDEPLAL